MRWCKTEHFQQTDMQVNDSRCSFKFLLSYRKEEKKHGQIHRFIDLMLTERTCGNNFIFFCLL